MSSKYLYNNKTKISRQNVPTAITNNTSNISNVNNMNSKDGKGNGIDRIINSGSNEYKYNVLYYKRSNKVHKSRLDGILTIVPPIVTLIDSSNDHDHDHDDHDNDNENDPKKKDNDECSVKNSDSIDTSDDESDDDDEEELKGMSYKKRMQAIRKKRNNRRKKKKKTAAPSLSAPRTRVSKKVLYSGKNLEISKRVVDRGGLQEDDVVLVPQWECQIISSFTVSTSINSTTSITNTTKSTLQTNRYQPLTSKRTLLTSSTNKYILARPKRPLSSLSTDQTKKKLSCDVDDSRDTERVVSKRAILSPPPPPVSTSSIKSSNNLSLPQTSDILRSSSKRRKVLLTKRRTMPTTTTTRLVKKITGTIPRTKHPTLTDQNGGGDSGIDPSFPGAIGGPIQAPNSIKNALRLHQRDGVTFLWNCLTGNSPALTSVVEERLETDDCDDESLRDRGGDGDDGNGGATDVSLEGRRRRMGRGAILADEMGLGKTLMTISIIFAFHRRNRNDRFIIVCPSSLVTNWANEFDKWVGRAMQPKRVVVRKGGEEGVRSIKAFVPVKPNKVEVLIVSYELFRINASILSQAHNIGLLVVDEGHRLKNSSGSQTLSALNSLRCDARLLITGTPIQNNLSEFHNIVNFVCPGILGNLNTFRRVYERPLASANNKNATQTQKERSETLGQQLESVTSSFMIRRLQKDVLKSLLPPRFETLLFCRPSRTQSDLYKTLSQGASLDHRAPSTSASSSDALTLLTRVRKLCSHPLLIEESFRSHITATALNDVATSGKLVVLQNLLTSIRAECPDDKVVIVSNFTSALSSIETMVLQKKSWSFLRLDGSVEQSSRQAIVDSFNRGSVENSFVLLLSSKAGGCGLNLIRANRLVMFDPDWNPATDMQAMARVYRPGQTKECFIYRMFTSGTVEEVIYQRQMQKNNLATLAMDSKALSRKKNTNHFTKEELQDCFTLKEDCDCDTKEKIGSHWIDYDGVRSLLKQDCQDESLLAMVRGSCEVLSFVHLMDDSSSPLPEIQSDKDTEFEEELSSASISASSSSDEVEFNM